MTAPRSGKFEYYRDRANHWRYRLKAANGEVVACGEDYSHKSNVKRGIKAVQRAAIGAPIVVIDP